MQHWQWVARIQRGSVKSRHVGQFGIGANKQQAKVQQVSAWQLVQRSFEKQKLHRKTHKSLNIWTCDVVGPRKSKQLKGYLLLDPRTIFSEVPFDNISLSLKSEATEPPQ